MNRRFVSFFYNTGGPGLGKDAAAAAFVRGKTKNVYAFFAAFTAEGEPLGVTDIYADKDSTFDFLKALLRDRPEYDRLTPEEQATLDRAAASPFDSAARLEAGRLLEDLGRYDEAEPHLRQATQRGATPAQTAEAYRALLRIARYTRRWDDLTALCLKVEDRKDAARLGLAADLAAERGFRLTAEKKWGALLELAETTIKKHPETLRMSELRFHAGVACWFLKDKERAAYHWCWVVENLPDDRLARRCFTAAAHEGMPYANPELGGYRASLAGGNIGVINRAYAEAKRAYQRVKEKEGR